MLPSFCAVKPSRLAQARAAISSLLDLLEGDRVGLVAFAGSAYVACPLTLDYAAASMFVDVLDTDLIPVKGTGIAAAIRKSTEAFKTEDRRNKVLQYACRLCRYTEPAPDHPLVYRNERKKEVGNILHTVPSAISDDPTLARSSKANYSQCGHNEAVFFQSDIAQADSLALIFVCCNCDHKWVN